MTQPTPFHTAIALSDERIRDLLCTAFEGGSNYWYSDLKPVPRQGLLDSDFARGGCCQPSNEYCPWYALMPTTKGCAIMVYAHGAGKAPNDAYCLDRAAIIRGIETMAQKFPHHFGDILTESDDATTADVFLQCCLFGELVFG